MVFIFMTVNDKCVASKQNDILFSFIILKMIYYAGNSIIYV